MVGTNIGAGQSARATRIAWTAAGLAVGLTGSIGLLAFAWPAAWTSFFSTSPAVQLSAASYLCIAGLAYPVLGLGLIMASTFQAAGRPSWPLLATAGRVVVMAGGGWLAIHAVGTGVAGLGLVAASGLVVYAATLVIAFRSGAWRKRTVA
jgi:Na+-driven multidrug efflux pump